MRTLPADCEVIVKEMEYRGDGSYYSIEWQKALQDKLIFILDWMSSAREDFFVVSDVDIQFFRNFRTSDLMAFMKQMNYDIAFQKETPDPASKEINGGFYIIKRSQRSENLFVEALKHCQSVESKNDQISINYALNHADSGLRWGHLPFTYYARSQGFPPPMNIVMHHANWATTVDEKIGQFRRVRNYIEGNFIRKMQAIGEEFQAYHKKGDMVGLIKRKLGKIRV